MSGESCRENPPVRLNGAAFYTINNTDKSIGVSQVSRPLFCHIDQLNVFFAGVFCEIKNESGFPGHAFIIK